MTDTAYLLPSAISHDHTRTTDYHSDEEELVSDGYSSEEDDEMGELSDSPSSHVSSSRPTTPSVNYGRNDVNRRAKSASPPISSSLNDRFTLAHKAEKILGLIPGTLPHARACLENARDEAKRLASESVMGPGSFGVSFYEPLPQGYSFAPSMDSDGSDSGATANGGQNGMRSRFDRAKRAMSVTLTSVQGRTPGVFVGVGGKDEEERRERRRRATDGVIYWQKQIAMLEEEEARVLRAQQQDQPRSLHHSKTVRKRR